MVNQIEKYRYDRLENYYINMKRYKQDKISPINQLDLN